MKKKNKKLIISLLLMSALLLLIGCNSKNDESEMSISIEEKQTEYLNEKEKEGGGIKYDHEYVFDEVKSIGMKQLMNKDIDTIIEMNIEDIEFAIEKIAREEIVIAKEPDIAGKALKMNDQQLNIIVGYYVDEVYCHARVTGVFKDEVKWYAMDLWSEIEPLSQIINRRLNAIVNNKEDMFSSNPYDYIEDNKDYDYLQ